ncbi:MAG: septal ring factor EnvC (AmiA/AmiB activator) [Gammaproteobacteria bacterium]
MTNELRNMQRDMTLARNRRLSKHILATSHWPVLASRTLKNVRVFSIAGFNCTTTLVAASDDKLEQLCPRVEKLEQSLASDGIKTDNARQEVLDIERLLYTAHKENENFRAQLDEKKSKIDKMTERRESLLRTQRNTAQGLGAIVAARYALWSQPKIKVLLNGKNISELQRYLQYYDYVAASSASKLAEYSRRLASVNELGAALKLEADKLRQSENQSRSQLGILAEALAGRSHLALALEQLLDGSDNALGHFQNNETQLSTLVDEVTPDDDAAPPTSAAFRELKGQLRWPATGAITKASAGRCTKAVRIGTES